MIARAELARRLDLATAETIRYAREFVVESLPDRALYTLKLKPTWLEGGAPIYDPEFASYWQRATDGTLAGQSAEQLIAELWHDGRAPEWVDLCVIDVDDASTHIEAMFSRTLTDRLRPVYPGDRYHAVIPFQIRGPYMPADTPYPVREKFSIHWRRNPARKSSP
jgi:hypothetical protein